MLEGFTAGEGAVFFQRRRLLTLGLELLVLLWLAMDIAAHAWSEEAVEEGTEVGLQSEIKDFMVEEEAPEEPETPEEPMDERAPPPPPNQKVKFVKNPPPPRPITDVTEKPQGPLEETDVEAVREVADTRGKGGDPGGYGTRTDGKSGGVAGGQGTGTGASGKANGEGNAPPKPKVKKKNKIDPTKPIDRPVDASPPRPLKSNKNPEYPKDLRDKGITGRFVIKLLVYMDGSVRSMKVLKKSNNATGSAAQADANKKFLSAIVKAVKSWKFVPSKLGRQNISVWHSVQIPFKLTL